MAPKQDGYEEAEPYGQEYAARQEYVHVVEKEEEPEGAEGQKR